LSKLSNNFFANIKFNNTSIKEIERIIKFLRLKNPHDYGETSTKILKACAPFISSLNYSCNKPTISGTFPTHLKYSIVKPLFKKGDKKNVTKYRPISLLSSFSKVFKKIIYKINNILEEEQFGFRPSASTNKVSYRLTEEILNALNNRMIDGGIFCDLQKAFDCVNHNILLTKSEFYAITGIFLRLIKSYLEGRYQREILNNNSPDSSSNWGEI
jgi:hypothetical protein